MSTRPSRAAASLANARIGDLLARAAPSDDASSYAGSDVSDDASCADASCASDDALSDASDDASGDASDDDEGHVPGRAPKTEEERDAEDAVRRGLGLGTKRELAQLRSAIRYVQRAMASAAPGEGFYQAVLAGLPAGAALAPAVRRDLCGLARELAAQVDLPYEEIAMAFAPLQPFNGGIFTTVSKRMREVFGVAVLADLVEQAIDVHANGTAQEQTMRLLLRGMGLGEDAAVCLASSSSDQTAHESVAAGGAGLVAKINALPPDVRLACCLAEVAAVRANGGDVVIGGPRGASRTTALYDHPYTRNAADTALQGKYAHVSVAVLAHEGSTMDAALRETFGADYGVSSASYPPLDVHDDLTTVCPLRAATVVEAPTPSALWRACDALLRAAGGEPTNLQRALDAAYPSRGERASLPLPPGSLLAVRYHAGCGRRGLKFGKAKATDRLEATDLSPDGVRQAPRALLKLRGSRMEMQALLFPPWIGFAYGTIELVVLPPPAAADTERAQRLFFTACRAALDLKKVKHEVSECRSAAAIKKATKSLKRGRRERHERALSEPDAEAVQEAGAFAAQKVLDAPLLINHPRTAYPTWSLETGEALEEAKRRRAEDLEVGARGKRAREAVEAHKAFCPGGEGYDRARAEFEDLAAA